MKLFVFPGNLAPEIRQAGAQEAPYARTDAFGALVHRCHHRLAALAGATDGTVLSFTASGTGAVEYLSRSNEEKTSAVHFLRFELDEDMRAQLKNGASLRIGVDHPEYGHEVTAPDAVAQALAADLI